MPWNGSGVFTRIRNWVNEAGVGVPILPAEFDEQEQDFVVAGFGNCITRDGQGGPTADIPWNNFGITGLRAPALGTDASNKAYVDLATGDRSMGGYKITALANPVAGTDAVNLTTLNATAMSAALPNQAGNVGKIVITDGVTATWTDTFTIAINEKKGANIASAATINLTTATGNFVHVTGTTTITGITIPVGAERTVIFDGILTLTHGAGLLLPGAANITTAANDRMIVRGDAAGAIVINYTRASGVAVKPGMTLLATLVPTAAAAVSFLTTFASLYDTHIIEYDGLLPSANFPQLKMRFGVAGVSDTGSNYYGAGLDPGATYNTAATSAVVGPATISSGTGANGEIKVLNANDATRVKSWFYISQGQQSSGPATYTNNAGAGVYPVANAVSGVTFFWSGGENFQAVGVIRIFGLNN